MANTLLIKTQIEPYIQTWLTETFPDHVFSEEEILLNSGGHHKFDAVSEDGSIVAAILCNRPKTRTGRENTGGVRKALGDIALLNLLPPSTARLMVFTDTGFHDLIRRRGGGKGIAQIQTMVCLLPADLEALLEKILDGASLEQRAAE